MANRKSSSLKSLSADVSTSCRTSSEISSEMYCAYSVAIDFESMKKNNALHHASAFVVLELPAFSACLRFRHFVEAALHFSRFSR